MEVMTIHHMEILIDKRVETRGTFEMKGIENHIIFTKHFCGLGLGRKSLCNEIVE